MELLQHLDEVDWQRESLGERCLVALWRLTHLLMIRRSPRRWHRWRAFWYRKFGARIDAPADVGRQTYIARPWKLTMGQYVSLSPQARVENLEHVEIGPHSVISQDAVIWNADRDPLSWQLRPIRSTIRIGAGVWIAAGAYVGPGVTIGDNSIIGARAVVTEDVPADVIVAGDPASILRKRQRETPIADEVVAVAPESDA
jgi:putative colanic acid biosynthesis acetyltransferase WcaF